jgi:hypothetical protein
MTTNTKLDEKLEGVDNFRAWKYRVMLILEENDLEGFLRKKFQNQREMRPRKNTRRAWSRQRESLQIPSRIT